MKSPFYALIAGLLLSPLLAVGAGAKTLEHTFREGETLWFLAEIYYGDGFQHSRIMKANGIRSSQKVRDGRVLKIPDPVYTADQPGFAVRLNHLRLKRAEKLATRLVASEKEPAKEKPARSEKARPRPGPRLPAPLLERKGGELSPVDRAKAELRGR